MLERNIKLGIAYDGGNYHGWQRQQDGISTVQETLELALVHVVKHSVSLRAAGRTDTGVHAAGQVANFISDTPIPTRKLPHAVNSRLPADIRITGAQEVPDDFDAGTSARSKLYRYTVYNNKFRPPTSEKYCYHFYHLCDVSIMQKAAALLMGEQDFAGFASVGSIRQTTIRTMMRCQIWRKYYWLYFDMEADGFLYHMVRNIVGTLLEIGRGHWPAEKITEILESHDRNAAGPMAPANGLSLRWVKY
ncbi:MAG: hypothetical protein AMJ79_04885 [Phycisphaerae bacterium SM23_30]|nr:MAG: hypothetical protein AMJ79_04885 [Phycisphaerae bacterium SM23_30]